MAIRTFLVNANIFGKLKESLEFMIKHWQFSLMLLTAILIIHQNFANIAVLRWIGIESIPHMREVHNAEVKGLNDKLAESETTKNKLIVEINNLNITIEKLAIMTSDLDRANSRLSASLTKMGKESNAAITSILKDNTPKTCQESIKYLKDAVRELKW